jgi:hypothetical protein
MKAAGILGLEGITFLEPGFADLTEDLYTTALLGIPAVGARLLVDEAEDPLAMAVSDGKDWYAASFLFRKPPREVIDLCEGLDCGLYQEERALWLEAVREYYSLLLARTTIPAMEDIPPGRTDSLRSLLEEVWGVGRDIPCLDCCCGSGVGSAVLRTLGMRPLSFDNDPSLLSLGLSTGRLLPGETMWIDATIAGRYLDPVPRGIAVMMGEINAFTAEMWENITRELLSLVDEAVITVGTEAEVLRVEGWVLASGHRHDVTENRRDAFYDRWVLRSRKNG